MGIQTQLVGSSAGTVDDGDTVIFDTVVTSLSPNISYSAVTGDFTITAAGNYYVTWWISTDGAEASTFVNFGIELDGGGAVPGTSPIVTGQLTGSALVPVTTVPATIALVNNTGAIVNFGATPVQANIVITEVGL